MHSVFKFKFKQLKRVPSNTKEDYSKEKVKRNNDENARVNNNHMVVERKLIVEGGYKTVFRDKVKNSPILLMWV